MDDYKLEATESSVMEVKMPTETEMSSLQGALTLSYAFGLCFVEESNKYCVPVLSSV